MEWGVLDGAAVKNIPNILSEFRFIHASYAELHR